MCIQTHYAFARVHDPDMSPACHGDTPGADVGHAGDDHAELALRSSDQPWVRSKPRPEADVAMAAA